MVTGSAVDGSARRGELWRNQPLNRERFKGLIVKPQCACLFEHVGNRAIAVDHDEEAPQRKGEIPVVLPELANAQLGLGVDIAAVHRNNLS